MTIHCARCRAALSRVERNELIESDFRSGMTLDDIGVKVGITRERVRQILKKRGVAPHCGGYTVQTIANAKERELTRRAGLNKRASRTYGCDFALALELNQGFVFSAKGSRSRAYVEQRRNAITRGIRWEINFPDWCRLWSESGRWDERGRGRGYCMSRIGDSGPYKLGNVEIISGAQNASDSYLITPGAERYAKSERMVRVYNPAHLSPRVRQALDLAQRGLTVTEIAKHLGVQRTSAWQYVSNARKKLALAEEQKKASQSEALAA